MDIKNLKPSKNSRYKQGYVNSQSCKKLFPSISHESIIYRSSYELKFIQWLESNKSVKYWGSECLQIPYYSGLDGKMHTYNPDYVVEMTNGDVMVVEIKPYNQTVKPINENCWAYKEYIKNRYKWKAAKEMCDSKGYKFKILTEKTINQL
jgi:hypothetical protein